MYHPTTRVLTVLELLQSHQRLSGPDLAARLEVNTRTVRRYVTMLQDLGIPIEAERGRHGAYRLRPGFKLPPLMFTDDEALALVLGLLATRRLGLAVAAPAVEGALAKIERVMPDALRGRVQAVQEILIVDVSQPDAMPHSSTIVTFGAAAQQQRQVRMRYRARESDVTERVFEPYGVVCRAGYWYTAGHCRLRDDLRLFRLDRVVDAQLCDDTFVRPVDFDTLDFVLRSLANSPGTWFIDVLLKTTLEHARAHIPAVLSPLEETPDGIVMQCYVQSLGWVAHFLAGLGCPFVIRNPPELRDELRALAESILRLADSASATESDDKMTR